MLWLGGERAIPLQHAFSSHSIALEGKINPPNLPGTKNEALVHLASETKDWHVEDAILVKSSPMRWNLVAFCLSSFS